MLIKDLVFEPFMHDDGDTLYTCCVEGIGRITVLHRMTGDYDCHFGTESGFRNTAGKLWLASGNFDIRDYPDSTIEEAIDKIKECANTCVGV